MIFDKIENISLYASIPHIEEIKKFLSDNDLSQLVAGDIAIKGEDLFVKILDYETQPEQELFFETHDKYIDLQFVISGKERMQITDVAKLEAAKGPDIEGDFNFFKPVGGFSSIDVEKGFFTVFFNDDAHRPGCDCSDGSRKVKKAVFKIHI